MMSRWREMSGEVSDEHVFRWLRANERNGRVSEKERSNTTILDTRRTIICCALSRIRIDTN